MFLDKIVFSKNIRTFKKGHTFNFKNNLTVISGENGLGKSTLIGAIRNIFDNKWTMSHDNCLEDILENKKNLDIKIGYIDLASDLYSVKPEIDYDKFDLMIKCNSVSSGEGAILQFIDFLATSLDFPLIIIDEPERGLSIRNQRRIAAIIKKHSMENPTQQIILTTHSEHIMSLGYEILSLSHKCNYISVDTYLKSMYD